MRGRDDEALARTLDDEAVSVTNFEAALNKPVHHFGRAQSPTLCSLMVSAEHGLDCWIIRWMRSLECDLLVVDETSMVDVPLMRALLRALPERSALQPARRDPHRALWLDLLPRR